MALNYIQEVGILDHGKLNMLDVFRYLIFTVLGK